MVGDRQDRREIVQFGRMMHDRGYVSAMDGNLSVRLDEERILCTPTSMCKGMMRPQDMVIVDPDGRHIAGRRDVSSEIGMHLLIYRLRPDVRGVVHAHPTTATGFAAAGIALDKPLVSEVVIGLGSIPLARYGTPTDIGHHAISGRQTAIAKEFDEKVASIHVTSLGGHLSTLSQDQADYIGVPATGPFKDDHYRY